MICECAMETQASGLLTGASVSSIIGILVQFGSIGLMRTGVLANSGFRRLDLLSVGQVSWFISGVAIGVFARVSRR